MLKLQFIPIVLCIGIAILALVLWLKSKDQQISKIAEQAYIYAYPLVTMDITQKTMTQNGKYLNTFIHIPQFPTDAFTSIVRPNVDTLYSFAWLDLSHNPLILSVPDTHERYYLIEFLDAWTNVFASIGKRTTGTTVQKFIITGPEWKKTIPDGYTHIQAPTNMVLLLARTQTYGVQDYAAVNAIQAGFVLTPLNNHVNNQESTTPVSPLFFDPSQNGLKKQQAPVDQVAAMDALTFYTTFAQALKNNPPAVADEPMLKQLKKIGIEPGQDFKSTPDLIAMLNSSMKVAMQKIIEYTNSIPIINGWLVMLNIGTYGTDYLTRAMITYRGIAANLPEDAVYPTLFLDANKKELTGSNNYRMHFDKNQIPPVNAFWSITLYNEASFLVKNDLNRYSLNDQDPLHFNHDGSLDIYIQHTSPGKEKESNWLPSPEGVFNLTMRLYWPKTSVLDGSWKPPFVEKVG